LSGLTSGSTSASAGASATGQVQTVAPSAAITLGGQVGVGVTLPPLTSVLP
jgi:hypothetical protein